MPSEYLKVLLKKLEDDVPLSPLELDYIVQNSRLTDKGREVINGGKASGETVN